MASENIVCQHCQNTLILLVHLLRSDCHWVQSKVTFNIVGLVNEQEGAPVCWPVHYKSFHPVL